MRDGLPPTHFLGHSTVLLEMGGVKVLTDPVLLSRVAGVLCRVGAALPPDIHHGVELVVISHLHADHLHIPSLRQLDDDVELVVPAGAGSFLRKQGFREVVELAPGESHKRSGLTVTATLARHDGGRHPFSFFGIGPKAMAVGYLLESAEATVYFAGDTELFPQMGELADVGLDLALLPVWGWGPNLGPGHLDPRQAAEAVRRLRPTYAVPIHWGTLRPYGSHRWMRRHLVEPPLAFAKAVAEMSLSTRVLHTAPGDRVTLW